MNSTHSHDSHIEKFWNDQLTAQRWLERARMDFRNVENLVPTSMKKSNFMIDPASAISNLQQTIEKTVKSLHIANGKPEKWLRINIGHASLAGYLLFLENMLDNEELSLGVKLFYSRFDFNDTREGFPKEYGEASSGVRELRKRSSYGKNDKDDEFWRGIAGLRFDAIALLIDSLYSLRKRWIRAISSRGLRLRPIEVDPADLMSEQGRANVIGKTFDIHGSDQSLIAKQQVIDAMSPVLRIPTSDFWESISHEPRQVIKPNRQLIRQQVQCNWAMSALYILAAITFPHEATSRYPAGSDSVDKSPSEAASNGKLGCEHYSIQDSEALGIVLALPKLVRITKLMLDDISPITDNILGLRFLTDSV